MHAHTFRDAWRALEAECSEAAAETLFLRRYVGIAGRPAVAATYAAAQTQGRRLESNLAKEFYKCRFLPEAVHALSSQPGWNLDRALAVYERMRTKHALSLSEMRLGMLGMACRDAVAVLAAAGQPHIGRPPRSATERMLRTPSASKPAVSLSDFMQWHAFELAFERVGGTPLALAAPEARGDAGTGLRDAWARVQNSDAASSSSSSSSSSPLAALFTPRAERVVPRDAVLASARTSPEPPLDPDTRRSKRARGTAAASSDFVYE